jgi:hypothetical protein
MGGLTEIPGVSQPPGEPRRRWFVSADLDLVVWLDESDQPTGFQLCYDRGGLERAVTWQSGVGFSHRAVDEGDRRGGKFKATPILVPDGPFPANRVAVQFADQSVGLPRELADFVGGKLRQHPDHGASM